MKSKSGEKFLHEYLVGKTLMSLEFGANTEGSRSVTFGQKIVNVELGMDEGREDAGVYLKLENGEDIFVYGNEGIGVKDET